MVKTVKKDGNTEIRTYDSQQEASHALYQMMLANRYPTQRGNTIEIDLEQRALAQKWERRDTHEQKN